MIPQKKRYADRYLAIVDRARRLLADPDGWVTTWIGNKPAAFTRIEDAAWEKYMA